jgi:hypothetical protein
VNRATQWTESTWSEITDHVAKTFRMTDEERMGLENHEISKLLAAIPFLAGCEQPMRTSLANLSIYMMSIRSGKEVFNASDADDEDILARLRLARFHGGDQQIVDRGMALIALNMLADYRRDVILDIANEKHNPIATGVWDYESIAADLVATVEAIECEEMDRISTVETIVDKFWNAEFFPQWF